MQQVVLGINQASEYEIDELIRAVLKRYGVLFPDKEISTISLPKSDDRNELIDMIISMLQNMKTTP